MSSFYEPTRKTGSPWTKASSGAFPQRLKAKPRGALRPRPHAPRRGPACADHARRPAAQPRLPFSRSPSNSHERRKEDFQ